MRILHVVSRLGYGDIERYLLTLVRSLDRAEFACDVACVGPQPAEHASLEPALRREGASVWHLPATPGTPRQLLTFRSRVLGGAYDVVQCHLGDLSGLFAAALTGSGVRVIATFHDVSRSADRSPGERLMQLAGRCWLNLTRVPLTGCSDFAILSHFRRSPRGFWRSAPYGVDTERFHPVTTSERLAARRQLGIPEERVVITQIGPCVTEQHVSLLLETAQRVSARLPRALFVLVGSDPLPAWAAQEIVRRDLGRAVHVAGATSVPEAYLRASDVYFVPGRFEGFGLALLEAHASGLPAVATDLPAFRVFATHWPAVRLARPRSWSVAVALLDVIADLDGARARALQTLPEIHRRFSVRASVGRWMEVVRAADTSGLRRTPRWTHAGHARG